MSKKLFSHLFFLSWAYCVIPFEAVKGIDCVNVPCGTNEFENMEVFKKGYEHLSPLWGFLANETHILENLRFYRIEPAYDPSNPFKREYAKDRGIDSITQMVKILFPSTGGVLSTQVHHYSGNLTQHITPGSVGSLLSFIQKVRENDEEGMHQEWGRFLWLCCFDKQNTLRNAINILSKTDHVVAGRLKTVLKEKGELPSLDCLIKKIKEKGIFSQRVPSAKWKANSDHRIDHEKYKEKITEKAKKFHAELCNEVCHQINEKFKKIKDPLEKETELVGNFSTIFQELIHGCLQLEKQKIYPLHTIEHIFLGFFWTHFNRKQEIIEMYEHIDEKYIHTDLIRYINPDEFLKYSDLQSFEESCENQKNVDLSDKTLEQAIQIIYGTPYFGSPSPYLPGTGLISNGTSHRYNRKDVKMGGLVDGETGIQRETFSDCAETSLRHLCNIVFWDGEKFNIENLERNIKKQLKEWKPNSAFRNMRELFYEKTQKQKTQVNASDITTRSLWNSVTADLNRLAFRTNLTSEEQTLYSVQYNQDSNELLAGFINRLNAIEHILGLDLEDFGDEKEQEKIQKSKRILLNKNDASNKEAYKDYVASKFSIFLDLAKSPNRTFKITDIRIFGESPLQGFELMTDQQENQITIEETNASSQKTARFLITASKQHGDTKILGSPESSKYITAFGETALGAYTKESRNPFYNTYAANSYGGQRILFSLLNEEYGNTEKEFKILAPTVFAQANLNDPHSGETFFSRIRNRTHMAAERTILKSLNEEEKKIYKETLLDTHPLFEKAYDQNNPLINKENLRRVPSIHFKCLNTLIHEGLSDFSGLDFEIETATPEGQTQHKLGTFYLKREVMSVILKDVNFPKNTKKLIAETCKAPHSITINNQIIVQEGQLLPEYKSRFAFSQTFNTLKLEDLECIIMLPPEEESYPIDPNALHKHIKIGEDLVVRDGKIVDEDHFSFAQKNSHLFLERIETLSIDNIMKQNELFTIETKNIKKTNIRDKTGFWNSLVVEQGQITKEYKEFYELVEDKGVYYLKKKQRG